MEEIFRLHYDDLRSRVFVDMNTPRPTDAELEILTVLWSRGPSTVRQVHETIAKRRPAQYTTILKLLQIMDGKELVKRDDSERAHVYRPAQDKQEVRQRLAGDLLTRAFEGSARQLMLGALSSKKTSPEELAELRTLLDEFEDSSEGEKSHRSRTKKKPGRKGDK